MKTKLSILPVALLCATFLMSCSKDDNYASKEEKMESYIPQDRGTMPEADDIKSFMNGSTMFLGNDASGEFKSLQRRTTKIVNSLENNDLQNIILAPNQTGNLTAVDASHLRDVIDRGGNIVLVNPDEKAVSDLAGMLGKTVEVPLIPTSQPLAFLAVKRGKAYLSLKLGKSLTDSIYIKQDPKSDVLTPVAVNYQESHATTDYMYGQKANALSEWLNTPAMEPPVYRVEDTNDIEYKLQDLVAAQEITIELGI